MLPAQSGHGLIRELGELDRGDALKLRIGHPLF